MALGELALTGCTTAADHHYLVPGGDDSVFDAIARAARTIGVRTHIARGSMDLGESAGGLPPDSVVEDRDAILASTQAVYDRLHDGDRIVVTVAPCSPFSVTTGLMTESAELARRLGVRLHTHLAETLDEERSCLQRFGKRPLAVLDDLGWIAPDVWVAHGIHFDDAEVARLGATGTASRTARRATAGWARASARTTDLVAAGAPVGLGVDGVASNEIGGLLPELRMALFLARQRSLDRPCSGRRTRCGWRPRAAPAASAGTTWGGWSPGCGPTSWSGRATTSPTCWTRSPASCWVRSAPRGTSSSRVTTSCRDGALVGADIVALRTELTRRVRRLWPEQATA